MQETTAGGAPTRWDMSVLYTGLDAEAYRRDVVRLEEELGRLEVLFDQRGVRRWKEVPTLRPGLAEELADILGRIGELELLADKLTAFVYAHVTTDSYDAEAKRQLSRLEMIDTRRQALRVRLRAWIGSLEPAMTALTAQSRTLFDHGFFLREEARRSRHLMDEELERLASELLVDGGGALGKLQGTLTSQVKVPFARDGEEELLPITVIRNLSSDPDPEVRERAHRAELEGWRSVETAVAASLSGVKGTALTLAKRRGRASVLEEALEQNRIDRATLDAMLGAIRDALPVFRRYMKKKAARLGLAQLRWWDLSAPVGETTRTYSWAEARAFIVGRFAAFSEELGAFAARAFDEHWIDGGPRDGKRGGAFCMPIAAIEQSRILANFDGSFYQVSTLAHELGHGFHNHCQRGLPPLLRGAPATLAETASIFCQTLICEAAIADAEPAGRLAILEAQLADAAQVCVDILSRYLFESRVLERRPGGELSAGELCDLMRDAQAETYGDGVDPTTYHPYMWLWKPHYYAVDFNFYNFPYAFGHLFGLGLYAVYREEGPAFVARYEELLRSTGRDLAAPLAKRFGIDITQRAFWEQSLALIAEQVEAY